MWESIVEALVSDLIPVLQPQPYALRLDDELLRDYPELTELVWNVRLEAVA